VLLFHEHKTTLVAQRGTLMARLRSRLQFHFRVLISEQRNIRTGLPAKNWRNLVVNTLDVTGQLWAALALRALRSDFRVQG
jgi:hypothetical protein